MNANSLYFLVFANEWPNWIERQRNRFNACCSKTVVRRPRMTKTRYTGTQSRRIHVQFDWLDERTTEKQWTRSSDVNEEITMIARRTDRMSCRLIIRAVLKWEEQLERAHQRRGTKAPLIALLLSLPIQCADSLFLICFRVHLRRARITFDWWFCATLHNLRRTELRCC